MLDPSVVLHIRAARVRVPHRYCGSTRSFLPTHYPGRTLLPWHFCGRCARVCTQALLLPLVQHGVMLLALAWNQHRVKNIPHRPGSGGIPLKRMTDRPYPGYQLTLAHAGFRVLGHEARAYEFFVGRQLPPIAQLSESEQVQHDQCLLAMQQHIGSVEDAWARLIARDHMSLVAGYLAFLMAIA